MRRDAAVVLGVLALLGLGPPAPAAADPEVPLALVLDRSEARPGERLTVRLDGWSSAAVTLTTCGNLGLRGAPDCDLLAGVGVGLRSGGPTLAELTITAPPAPCPCVVRAWNPNNREVHTAELAIPGLLIGPVTRPVTPELVRVSATVTEVRRGTAAAVRALLGGRTHHRVRVRVRNVSGVTLSRLTLGLAVGRGSGSATSVPVPPVEPLDPGATSVYDVETSLAAPVQGRFRWVVTVYGAGPLAGVEVRSSANPWLLYGSTAMLVADLAVIGSRRVRRRRRRRRERRRALLLSQW